MKGGYRVGTFRDTGDGYGTRLYGVWYGMLQRCNYGKHIDNKWYSAKNITVCDEWLYSFKNFKEWALENGYDENAPRGACTLDRIDNNLGYSPENCRFIDSKAQANNRSTNINIEYMGKTQTLKQWAEELGMKYSLLYSRYKRRGVFEECLN